MLREVCADLPNVTVMGFTGLIVDFCREIDAQAIVKGLRGGNDYEYELPMAQMNAHLTGVETVFMPTNAVAGLRVLEPGQGGRLARRRRLRRWSRRPCTTAWWPGSPSAEPPAAERVWSLRAADRYASR